MVRVDIYNWGLAGLAMWEIFAGSGTLSVTFDSAGLDCSTSRRHCAVILGLVLCP